MEVKIAGDQVGGSSTRWGGVLATIGSVRKYKHDIPISDHL